MHQIVRDTANIISRGLAGAAIGLLGYCLFQDFYLKPVEPLTAADYKVEERPQSAGLPANLITVENEVFAEARNKPAAAENLESIAHQAEPYVAEELGLKRINRPRILTGTLKASGQYALFGAKGFNYLEISDDVTGEIICTRLNAIHELIHAQKLALPYYKLFPEVLQLWGKSGSVFNEVYTQVATLEVLSNEALDGTEESALALFNFLNIALSESNQPSLEQKNDLQALDIFLDAANGKIKSYEGLKLDGIYRFANQKTLAVKAR